MTTRRTFLSSAPAAGALLALTPAALSTPVQGQTKVGVKPAGTKPDWRSLSLGGQPAKGPNGVIAAADTLTVNERMGADRKVVDQVAPGVWHIRGWGIAHSIAIDAPGGWIIIDTGDSNKAATEMRTMLEASVGGPIKVAAILWTHWHYTDGTAAWLDKGTVTWGHERLDANRTTEAGLSPFRGVALSRMIAQFGVLHPLTGPDAFPNVLGFGPEKFVGESSYQPPQNTFPDGQIFKLTLAGEEIEVAPSRTDTTCSVAFWFPGRKVLVTNFMVTPIIFNVFSLRGGRIRNPDIYINDARWLEGKDAELLLDIHNAPVKGRAAVQAAIERNVDQVQQILDQTIRLISHGLDARQAAEAIAMTPGLRDGAELYGQVESHVRAVWGDQRGWFGSDVYDINPLSERQEATRLIAAMGGAESVRKAAATAVADGGLDNWRWALKLTSLLLALDPADGAASASRIVAARALGQRTNAANARGWYITEALQREDGMLALGQPVTLDLLRRALGTPQKAQLTEAPVASVLEYMRHLVDPSAAGDRRVSFTLAVEGDPTLHRVHLRNGVLIISTAEKAEPIHVVATREQVADFVLGAAPLPGNAAGLAKFGEVFDRSQFLPRESLVKALGSQPPDLY